VQLELVKRFLADDQEGSASPVVKGPISKGEFSKVFYAETPACPYPLAVKQCISRGTGLPDANDASEQFQALQAIEPLMAGGEYAVPRPYKLDADNGLVAIEWFNGQTVTDYLKDLRYPIIQMEEMLARTGTWLQHFHTSRHVRPGTFDAEKRFSSFTANMSTSLLGADHTFMRACQLLEEKKAGLENQSFPRALLHGDFKSDNLLIADDRLIGIDIQSRDQNLVLWDIVPFLNRLGLLIYSPSGWHLKRNRAGLEHHFLSGYFGRELTPNEAAAIAWLRLLILLQQWDQRHLAMENNPLKRIANNWVYRHEAQSLCTELSTSST
jgi:Ser/Thr protein kinase RdoA (MazF antagonist)